MHAAVGYYKNLQIELPNFFGSHVAVMDHDVAFVDAVQSKLMKIFKSKISGF